MKYVISQRRSLHQNDHQVDCLISPGRLPDISSNIVIRGLAFHTGDNLNTKLNNLLKHSPKLRDIQATNTVRKYLDDDSRPGFVIAALRSTEENIK